MVEQMGTLRVVRFVFVSLVTRQQDFKRYLFLKRETPVKRSIVVLKGNVNAVLGN